MRDAVSGAGNNANGQATWPPPFLSHRPDGRDPIFGPLTSPRTLKAHHIVSAPKPPDEGALSMVAIPHQNQEGKLAQLTDLWRQRPRYGARVKTYWVG